MNAVKKILIPTDFNIKSLNVLLELLDKETNSCFEIIFAHGYEISFSISDLLFYSEYKTLDKLQSEAFKESCKLIENTHESRIKSIRSKILTGNSKRYIANFIKDNAIDLVVYNKNYKMQFKSSNSFNLIPHLKSIKIEKLVVEQSKSTISKLENTEQLADIFYQTFKL